MNFLVRPPKILRRLYKKATWRGDGTKKAIYLTFDDGPIPTLTEWILDILKEHHIKATFFCVGENIAKHPSIFERIKQEGHQIGNHTYNHVKGWKVAHDEYINNMNRCQSLTQTNLFRPPYGRITKQQYRTVLKTHRIILWDVLTYDYDKFTSPQKCLKKSLKHTRNGSIIVFHDNVKATENITYALPLYIQGCLKSGYEFKTF